MIETSLIRLPFPTQPLRFGDLVGSNRLRENHRRTGLGGSGQAQRPLEKMSWLETPPGRYSQTEPLSLHFRVETATLIIKARNCSVDKQALQYWLWG